MPQQMNLKNAPAEYTSFHDVRLMCPILKHFTFSLLYKLARPFKPASFIMSRSTFTSPQNDHTVSDPSSRDNLFGLLEQRLNQHNAIRSDPAPNGMNGSITPPINDTNNLTAFANQFEKIQMRRRLSHGENMTTPYNSPAIHQLQAHNRSNGQRNQRHLSGFVSPLHLSIVTPPCTPDDNHKTLGRCNPSYLLPSS